MPDRPPVEFVYAPALAEYRFPAGHPMRPERFTLMVSLARSWGLIGDEPGAAPVVAPQPATDADLLLVHTPAHIAYVKAVSVDPLLADMSHGIGPGDTPAVIGLHDAAALAVGSTMEALEAVLQGRATRAFNPAGGLHHAHRDHASGFCVYNDLAIAIERATRERPGLRVAYLDIDAHHGDGVEAVFAERADVLTASIHESGEYLFPGTGASRDRGRGPGEGYALNVPLPPHTGDDEFLAAFDAHVVPAVVAFAPDVMVAQLGADAHAGDPLTHLDLSVEGYVAVVARIVALADRVCGGRLACTGGGGYQPYDEVPIMWSRALAVLLGRPDSPAVPEAWRETAEAARAAATAEA